MNKKGLDFPAPVFHSQMLKIITGPDLKLNFRLMSLLHFNRAISPGIQI